MDNLNEFTKYLPLIIPLVLIDLGLIIYSLVDLVRREKTKGPKWVWALVILFVSTFGPIIYLLFGRDE